MSKRNAPKIACPACGCPVSKVIARGLPQVSGMFYRRHRRCEKCGSEFETREHVATCEKNATYRALRESA